MIAGLYHNISIPFKTSPIIFPSRCTLSRSHRHSMSYCFSEFSQHLVLQLFEKKFGCSNKYIMKSHYDFNLPFPNVCILNLFSCVYLISVQVSLTIQKFVLCHFTFPKDWHQYLVLLTDKNPERIFAFMK